MKQEEKDLILKDLCARLPYGVKCQLGKVNIITLFPQQIPLIGSKMNIKPYLRPMSSMTKDEEKEYNGALTPLGDFMFEQEELFKPIQLYKNIPFELYEFFNAHQFDYHGLIEKGLAIEAPEGMYDIMKKILY